MDLQHPDTQPIYYVGLNKEVKWVWITEQEGLVVTYKLARRQDLLYTTWLRGEISLPTIGAVSVGIRHQVLNIWGQKVMGTFFAHSQHSYFVFQGVLPPAMRSLTWHFHVNSMLPVMPSFIPGFFCSPHRPLPFKYVCTHVYYLTG